MLLRHALISFDRERLAASLPLSRPHSFLKMSARTQYRINNTITINHSNHSLRLNKTNTHNWDVLPCIGIHSVSQSFTFILFQRTVVVSRRLGRYGPLTRRTETAKLAFSVAAANVWNSLSIDIRNTDCLSTFRNKLKTHFYSSIYMNTWPPTAPLYLIFHIIKKVKADGNPVSELRDVTCRMGSHSVTSHPTQVNAPHLTPAMQAGTPQFRAVLYHIISYHIILNSWLAMAHELHWHHGALHNFAFMFKFHCYTKLPSFVLCLILSRMRWIQR